MLNNSNYFFTTFLHSFQLPRHPDTRAQLECHINFKITFHLQKRYHKLMRDSLQLGNKNEMLLWERERRRKGEIKFSWKLRSDKKCFCLYSFNETIFHCIYSWKLLLLLLLRTVSFAENVLWWKIQWKTVFISNGIVKFQQFYHFFLLLYNIAAVFVLFGHHEVSSWIAGKAVCMFVCMYGWLLAFKNMFSLHLFVLQKAD